MEMLMVCLLQAPGSVWMHLQLGENFFVENDKFSRRGMTAQTRLICWTAYPFLQGIPTQNRSV